jgi:histidine phosphotransferase ChpT
MKQGVDLTVFELLASRLCHDLVSPVGAVKSGLELFTEFGDDPDGETMALINGSAEQASQKLQCFRFAYGQSGAQRDDVSLAELVGFATAVCGNQRTRIEGTGDAIVTGMGHGKILINLAFVAAEAIGRGGVVTLGATGGAMRATAEGDRAEIDAAMIEALTLAAPVEALTPKTVQGYYAGLLAQRVGKDIEIDTATPGRVSLAVTA